MPSAGTPRTTCPPPLRRPSETAQAPSAIDLEKLQASESEGLLHQLVHQRARLQQLVGMATDFGDVKAAVSAEGAIAANLQLVSRLLGMLINRRETRSTSILISSDYLALRAAIVAALRPYPQAARAVGEALHRLEAQAAHDITAAAGGHRPEPKLIEHELPPLPQLGAPPC
jgi:hypothetical protein